MTATPPCCDRFPVDAIHAGPAGPGQGLHGDRYVFNDAIVPIVLRHWRNLVEQSLPV